MGSPRDRSRAFLSVPYAVRTKEAKVLGDIIVLHLHLRARCRQCDHRAGLSPVELAQRLGYDFPVPNLFRRLRCSKCGRKQIVVTMLEPERG
jgi:hypothetical protein